MKTLLLTLIAVAAVAQTPEAPEKFYKLDLVLKELEAGKIISTRTYSMALSPLSSKNPSSVRTGDKIAVPSGSNNQFSYLDVGVNIDCRFLSIVNNELMIQISADISNAIERTGGPGPTIVQTRWNGVAVIPLRKAVTVFSADGASNKRQTQLEITAIQLP